MQPKVILLRRSQEKPGRSGRCSEIHAIGSDPTNELRAAERVKVSPCLAEGPTQPYLSETCSKVAYHIDLFRNALRSTMLVLIDRGVLIGQVPVVDERHHHP